MSAYCSGVHERRERRERGERKIKHSTYLSVIQLCSDFPIRINDYLRLLNFLSCYIDVTITSTARRGRNRVIRYIVTFAVRRLWCWCKLYFCGEGVRVRVDVRVRGKRGGEASKSGLCFFRPGFGGREIHPRGLGEGMQGVRYKFLSL